MSQNSIRCYDLIVAVPDPATIRVLLLIKGFGGKNIFCFLYHYQWLDHPTVDILLLFEVLILFGDIHYNFTQSTKANLMSLIKISFAIIYDVTRSWAANAKYVYTIMIQIPAFYFNCNISMFLFYELLTKISW